MKLSEIFCVFHVRLTNIVLTLIKYIPTFIHMRVVAKASFSDKIFSPYNCSYYIEST